MAVSSIDDQNKKADIQLKKAQTKELNARVKDWEKEKIEIDKQRVTIDKINSVRNLLESIVVDEEKTMPGSDIKFKRVFDEEETKRLKSKLMQLLARL